MQTTTKEAKMFLKEDVYTFYLGLGLEAKDYDKVTRPYMLNLIYNNLTENPEELYNHASIDAILFLQGLLKSSKTITMRELRELDSKNVYPEASDGLLVYSDLNTGEVVIPNRIRQLILDFKTTNNHKQVDDIYLFVKGLVNTRGVVSLDIANDIFKKLYKKKLFEDFTIIVHNLTRLYLFLSEDALMFNNNLTLDIFHPDQDVPQDYKPKYKYTWDMYMSVAKYGVNRLNPELEKIYKKLETINSRGSINFFIESLLHDLWRNTVDEDLQLRRFGFYNNFDEEQTIDMLRTLTNHLPNMHFLGDPLTHVDFKQVNFDEHDNNDPTEYGCLCGSGKKIGECCLNEKTLNKNKGVLDEKTGQSFFFFLQFLLFNINEEYGIVEKTDILSFFQLDISERDYEKLINLLYMDEYFIRTKNKELNPELQRKNSEFVRAFENKIESTFVAIKFIHQKLLVADIKTQKLYLVSGLSEPLSFKVHNDKLPTIIKMKLLPLNNYIVYDSTFSIIQIKMGPEIVKLLESNLESQKYITKFADIK